MLSYINDYGLSEAMMTTPEIFNTFYTYCSKEDMYDRLLHIARRIFEVRMKSKNRHDNSIIKKIQRYIVSNLSGDLSLETIGDIFYMNPAYMSRLYKQTTGQNISDYITKKRMELANKLLLHSEMKIYIIAKEVGYASPAYFNRIFKKIESVTPQEYREKHKILS
jgi:two-component system response regulator YesN